MKKEIDWLKISGIACTILGGLLSILSESINKKQTELEISRQVEEQVRLYMEGE